tara:strand:- start:9846 stop:11165 length:1320 start_codon:yes stop_codon:yes gene_type:complete
MSLHNLIIIIKNFILNKLVFFHGVKSFYLNRKFKNKKKHYFFIKKINEYLKKNNKKIINLRSNAFGFSLIQIDYIFKYINYYDLDLNNIIFISEKIKNTYLKKILKDKLKINILEYKNIFNLLVSTFPKKKYFKNSFIVTPADCGNYNHPSSLKISFTNEEILLGETLLKKLGIQNNKKFAIISYKSATYNNSLMKNNKILSTHEISQQYRISSFKNLLKTLNYLEDNDIKPLIFNCLNKEELEFFKKYSKINDLKSKREREFLEFYSHYKSYLSICGNSGDQFIPKLFNKKTLFHNSTIPHSISDGIFLPKKFYDVQNNKILNLQKVMSKKILYYEKSDISKIFSVPPIYFRDTKHFEKKNIKILENSEDEILNATKELVFLINNNNLNLTNDQIIQQNKIKKIYYDNFYTTEDTLVKKNIGGYISPSFLLSNKDFYI